MRGLPFSATKQDVLEFLCDIHIVNGKDGIFLIKTAEGKPTGDAFVLLASEDDAVQALGRHKVCPFQISKFIFCEKFIH